MRSNKIRLIIVGLLVGLLVSLSCVANGMEVLTDRQMDEVRGMCGEEWCGVSVPCQGWHECMPYDENDPEGTWIEKRSMYSMFQCVSTTTDQPDCDDYAFTYYCLYGYKGVNGTCPNGASIMWQGHSCKEVTVP